MTAASSTVPRPRTRTPPRPSSAMVRNRPRCADRSNRSSAASSARAVPSGSSTSSRWSPALRSSEAFNDAAWSSSTRSASSRRPGSTGSRSITATITSACSGETSPAVSASSVAVRSPHRPRAVRSSRCPCPRRPPDTDGEVVTRRHPAGRLRSLGGLDLDRDPGLDRGDVGAEPFELDAHREQRRGVLGRPQLLVQPGQQLPGRDHRAGGAGGGEIGGVLHVDTQPGSTDTFRTRLRPLGSRAQALCRGSSWRSCVAAPELRTEAAGAVHQVQFAVLVAVLLVLLAIQGACVSVSATRVGHGHEAPVGQDGDTLGDGDRPRSR